jgi:hypothetical protein
MKTCRISCTSNCTPLSGKKAGTYPVREKKAEHQHAPIDLLVLAKNHRGVHHSMTLTPYNIHNKL